MSFQSMQGEIRGCVPKIPFDYAKTIVNRAWSDVRRQSLWSFLMFESNWTSPGPIQVGTATTVQGQNTVTFNATASAAISAVSLGPPSTIIQRQFRIGSGTIYNIWGYDNSTPTAVVLTLDRPVQEASVSGSAYIILQCYYAAPVADWWSWLSVRDIVNNGNLITGKLRSWIDDRDPQRLISYLPTHVVPYQIDQNPASPTYGRLLFELWGQPQQILTYQLYGLRKGVDLVNPTDTLPFAIGEDCVLALARKYAYEWAEANKGDQPRDAGSDYRYLMGNAAADYKRLFSEYRRQDRALVDNFKTKVRRSGGGWNNYGFYNSISGTASPGQAW